MASEGKTLPRTEQSVKEIPDAEQAVKAKPGVGQRKKPVPKPDQKLKEKPMVGETENVVFVNGKPVEIKPTKLKYFRNRTASFYKVLEVYPMSDIMTMAAGTFGDDRDGDKATLDW